VVSRSLKNGETLEAEISGTPVGRGDRSAYLQDVQDRSSSRAKIGTLFKYPIKAMAKVQQHEGLRDRGAPQSVVSLTDAVIRHARASWLAERTISGWTNPSTAWRSFTRAHLA
jgi:hypothetical protein